MPCQPDVTDLTWRRLLDPTHLPGFGPPLDDQARIVGIVHFHVHASTWSRVSCCYLEDLFVDPTCRGHGIGRALIIEAVYRAADDQGAERVYWHGNTNVRAQSLYRQLAELTPFVQFHADAQPSLEKALVRGTAEPISAYCYGRHRSQRARTRN